MSEVARTEALAPVVPILDASKIKLTVLSTEQAVTGWELIAPYLERVFEYSAGRIDLAGTLKTVEEGMAEVLLIWDPEIHRIYAVIVAEARKYPNRNVYSLGLCGGSNIHLWAERIWPALIHVAKEKGYDQLEIVGRRGWGRFIPGAEEIATWYSMDLDEQEETT